MTTEAAAKLYLAQHEYQFEGRPVAVWNPHARPIAELPTIYGFNNGGSSGWLSAVAMSQDGKVLGQHICSAEGYMPHDLGILEGTRLDRHENHYRRHYPDGYRMEFVPYPEIASHVGLQAALALANADDGNAKA